MKSRGGVRWYKLGRYQLYLHPDGWSTCLMRDYDYEASPPVVGVSVLGTVILWA